MKKEKIEKEGKINLSTLVFCFQYCILLSSCCIQNLKTLAQIEAEKSVTENFVREKEKWTNKGTDKQYVADSRAAKYRSPWSDLAKFRTHSSSYVYHHYLQV